MTTKRVVTALAGCALAVFMVTGCDDVSFASSDEETLEMDISDGVSVLREHLLKSAAIGHEGYNRPVRLRLVNDGHALIDVEGITLDQAFQNLLEEDERQWDGFLDDLKSGRLGLDFNSMGEEELAAWREMQENIVRLRDRVDRMLESTETPR